MVLACWGKQPTLPLRAVYQFPLPMASTFVLSGADALEITLTQELCYILITEHFLQEGERRAIARARSHPIPPFCVFFAETYRTPACAAFYLV